MLVLHSGVSPGAHPHRDLPSCHNPLLDKMVSAGAPHVLSGVVLKLSGSVSAVVGSC